eukprot:GABW01001238.1.p1 GENE.GABW01001238.1~~GABW01001238.1.p1  ORF type:complete len:167 (+),score=59.41 GABW01001238.1:37-537(+)
MAATHHVENYIAPTHRGLKNPTIEVNSENVKYTEGEIISEYMYGKNEVHVDGEKVEVVPKQYHYTFKTQRKVPKAGLLLVGWGGNNGSTVTAGVIANRKNLSWETRTGTVSANYYGSLTQCTTIRIGADKDGKEVHVPFKNVLPMVNPTKWLLVVGILVVCLLVTP